MTMNHTIPHCSPFSLAPVFVFPTFHGPSRWLSIDNVDNLDGVNPNRFISACMPINWHTLDTGKAIHSSFLHLRQNGRR